MPVCVPCVPGVHGDQKRHRIARNISCESKRGNRTQVLYTHNQCSERLSHHQVQSISVRNPFESRLLDVATADLKLAILPPLSPTSK